MNITADLHVHGRYSRATSKQLSIQNLEKWAITKGVNLLGTGDFTHPEWIKEIKTNLSEIQEGILRTKTGFPFILQTEISLIYSQGGKGRRIHHVVLAPNLDVVDQITEYLKKTGRVDYDGRPIFGISSPDFVESLKQISNEIEIIPAHAWTSWFGLLGSNSGFDSLRECFQDQTKHIHAIETGLSSDPPMNRRLSQLDRINLVSFSDLHSFWPWRIGREATIFDCDLTYKNIIKSIRTGEGLKGTVEVDPSYGKYHFTGHRACNVCLNPQESSNIKNICPKCKRKLTVGVLERVEELADRPEDYKPKNILPFYRLIPLTELVAAIYGIKQLSSKKVWGVYNDLIYNFKSEFNILLNVKYEDLEKVVGKKLADLIIKNRQGKLKVKPGYDGVYGELILGDIEKESKQITLSKF